MTTKRNPRPSALTKPSSQPDKARVQRKRQAKPVETKQPQTVAGPIHEEMKIHPKLKAEVLAPAGNREVLEAAFAAGADAVYFALPAFGARAYAKNFSLEEAGEIIDKAHLAGRKVYITMNTLIEEGQMEQAYQQAKALHEAGVDALIIQDLGLIHLLHHRLPELELHASTQLSVSTPEQIRRLQKIGDRRVVLAREATLDEIEACAQTGMELEVFVHGALCISYSGQCRFSQVRYNRSGNKGACAQPCRMEYTLLEDGEPIQTPGHFLLSPRDLSALTRIDQLVKAGAYSLKIEGRMKSPEYVYESVKAARKAVDGYALDDEDLRSMQTAFNRGFTLGHAFEKKGLDLMNPITSNHQGVPIGRVLSASKDKVKIKLSADLRQNDGLRFVKGNESTGQIANFIFNEQGKLISNAKANDIVEVKVPAFVHAGSEVRKTSSFVQNQTVQEAVRDTIIQAPVEMKLSAAKIGDPIVLEISDGLHTIEVQGDPLQAAQKAPSTFEQMEKSLKKTKDSWAKVERVSIDLPDHVFVRSGELNELRRQAVEQLGQIRMKKKPIVEKEYDYHPKQPARLESFEEIMKPEQIQEGSLLQISEFPLPNVMRKGSLIHDQQKITDHLGQGSIVEKMNLTNSYALAALLEMGYQGGVLADELSDEGRKQMLEAFQKRYGFQAPAIMTVYEKPRLMIMNHCPVNTTLADGSRENCARCRIHRYELKGKDGKKAFLYGNADCQMQIFDEQPIDRIDEVNALRKEGVEAFRIVLSDESRTESEKITERFKQVLQSA